MALVHAGILILGTNAFANEELNNVSTCRGVAPSAKRVGG
jgi:hypothetical protein